MKNHINIIILIFMIVLLIPKTVLAIEENEISKDSNLNDIIYDGEKFLAVGDEGLIYVSINGQQWDIIESHSNRCLKSIAYKKGYGYIILGDNNTLLYSKDSLYWEKKHLHLPEIKEENFKKIVYGDNKFIILGDKHVLLSEDKVKWDIISLEDLYKSSDDTCSWKKFILDRINYNSKHVVYKDKYVLPLPPKIMSSTQQSNSIDKNEAVVKKKYVNNEKNETSVKENNKNNSNSVNSEITSISLKDYVICEDSRESFYIQSKSSGKVQYRILIYDLNEEKWDELTEGYSRAVQPTKTYIVTPNKKFKEGLYMVSVWVRSVDSAGIGLNSNVRYDSYSVTYLKCGGEDYNSEMNLTEEQVQYQYILSLVNSSTAWAVINKDNSIGKKGEKVEILMDKQNGELYKINKDSKIFWIDGSLLDPIESPPGKKKRLSAEESEIFINSKDFSSNTSYFIWVDIGRQIVNIFKYENDKYNLIKVMSCASGKIDTPTVRGEYKISERGDEFYSDRMGMGAKYWVRFYKSYLFHSFPIDRSENILDTTLGERASHGCIRLSMEDSKWIYDNMPYGTKVWIN